MRSRNLSLSWVLLLLMAVSPVRAADDTGKEIYKKVLAGTVYVIGKSGTGTGWIYDREKKIVVTNYHVVAREEIFSIHGDGATTRRIVADPVVHAMFPISMGGDVVRERSFYSQNRDRFAITARVLYADPKRDIAFLELDSIPESASALDLAWGTPDPGERVHSVGNPGASGSLWVYTSGTVRSVYQKQLRTAFGEHEFEVVETSSPLNPGDSGGPVVNDQGRVVALVQSGRSDAQLISHCVAVSEVQAIVGHARAAKSPESVDDYYSAAQGLFHTGQYQAAIDKLNAALEIAPDDAWVWHLRGSCYANLLQFQPAIADMNKSISLRFEPLFYYERGLCRMHARDLSGAIEDFNHAISVGYSQAEVYYSRGVTYGNFKQWSWAIADYTSALEKNPSHFRALSNRASAYYHRSQTAGDADWHRAMNDARRVLQIAPSGDPIIENAESNIRRLLQWRDGR